MKKNKKYKPLDKVEAFNFCFILLGMFLSGAMSILGMFIYRDIINTLPDWFVAIIGLTAVFCLVTSVMLIYISILEGLNESRH